MPSSDVKVRTSYVTITSQPTIDVLSSVATIDHDVLAGVEEDQHHTKSHYLDNQVDHVGGFVYKSGVDPVITDTDMTNAGIAAAADGQVAVTFDVMGGTTLVWTRLGGSWAAVEVSE